MEINEYSTNEISMDFFSNPPRTGTHCLDQSKFSPGLSITEHFLDGCRITTAEGSVVNGHHVLCAHGGAFVFEATEANRIMAEKLAFGGFRASILDYPLAPEHSVLYTSEWMVGAFRHLSEVFPNDIFHFLGDSAGGGLTLTTMQLLRDRSVARRPLRNALVSPMMDAKMRQPDLAVVSEEEVLQLSYAGKLYAGEAGVDSPLASPLYGNLDHLGAIYLTYDADEIFSRDCATLVSLVTASIGTQISTRVVKGLYHDYAMACGLPEAETAVAEMCAFFLGENRDTAQRELTI